MKINHTAGQWEISKTVNDYAIYADTNDTKDIAAVYQYSRNIPKEEAEANAKLIAAAPELLRMLKVWQSAIDIIVSTPEAMDKERLKVYQSLQQSETYKQTTEAINKATN